MALSTLAPGFRFHPMDDELVMWYLKRKLLGMKTGNDIAEVNIYDFSPWDLPDKSSSKSRDLEWFFFCPIARKYLRGFRSNRATTTGFWKATGEHRKVKSKGKIVAIKKSLVFHEGHTGNGKRTDWVMHEYKMEDEHLANANINQDDIQGMYVVCRIFKKEGAGPKNGAQYGALFNEKEWGDDDGPDESPNPLDHKQKGPESSLSLAESGSSSITFSANNIRSTQNYKQKGPAITDFSTVTEPDPSTVTFSANGMLSYKQKTVPQSIDGVPLTEPGSSTLIFSADERHVDVPANSEVMLFGDIASILGTSSDINDKKEMQQQGVEVGNSKTANHMACNEDEIYGELNSLFDLDDFNDGADYNLDMGAFYVD